MKAVKIIANARGSKPLLNWIDTGNLGETQMDIGEAYQLLNINDRSLDDSTVMTVYNVAVSDNPASAEQYNKAITAIASARDSPMMLQALQGGGNISEQIAPADWPVGLENIGNTCYLNSLLQFFFTLPELRNLVLNFDEVKMDLDSSDVSNKRVGSRHITLQEIDRAQKCKDPYTLLQQAY